MAQGEDNSREKPAGTTTGTTADKRWDWPEFHRYLVTMLGLLVVLYCAPFALVRLPNFDQWSGSPYSQPLNYAFKTGGENADVVLFGDSTLLHGVDPTQMSAALGVKVILLPSIAATLRELDDLALRRYLKANRAPRLIVLYFAPWDLDYSHSTFPIGTYDARELLARQGTAEEIFGYARRHPFQSMQFPFQFYLINGRVNFFERPYPEIGLEAERTRGHMTNPQQTRLDSNCTFPEILAGDALDESAKELGQRYGTSETKILYFIAPIPNCRNAAEVATRSYGGLPAGPPRVLPAEMFSSDAVVLHPLGSAVPRVTQNLIDAVRPVLAEKSH